ncbi:MAG: iron ABC transporter permease [Planctomycetota bacterium]|nr:iron ABC transporter permease [Planctomycetota bacterium]
MNRWSGTRLAVTLICCAAAVVGVGAACMFFGSTADNSWAVLNIRRQTVGDAALIGAALAAAGVAYQAVLRNPLADPYLLGVSSGATLAAYLWRLPIFAAAMGAVGITADAIGPQAAAMFGALVAVTVVLGIAGARGRIEPVTLLLVGVIVNAVNGSILVLIYKLVFDLPGSGGSFAFLVGGIQQTISHGQRMGAVTLVAMAWIVLLYISGELNAAGLDDAEAEALGVRIHRLRWIALIAASLATAAAVAISGPIGFVGLVCPHIGRLLVGSDQRRLLPVSTTLGAILLMVGDAISRYLAAQNRLGTKIEVGVLTGLIGGPFFLWLLFHSRRRGFVSR